jgi:hypothetical protein
MLHSLCRTRTAVAPWLVALLAASAFAKAQAPTAAADGFDTRIAAHLDAARTKTLAACLARAIELPADFLAFVDADPVRRASVWGCRKDPLAVLLALRSLELDLGPELVRRDHPQLALAFAIQRSCMLTRDEASGWNDGDGEGIPTLPDVSPRAPLVLTIPGDPRQPVATKDPGRTLDRDDHIVNFLEHHAPIEVDERGKELPPLEYDERGVAKPRGKAVVVTRQVTRPLVAADVIASPALQAEFTSYMAAHGHPDLRLDTGDRAVHWHSTEAISDQALRERIAAAHQLFLDAYRRKGRLPMQRDRAPSMAESMAWLVRNDRHAFAPEVKQARGWPRFPLQAPWPLLLMLAADDQPLREREAIWLRFRDHGELETYGEYIGGIAQQFDMQSARRLAPFPFAYGSIQMMWKDGGVCGTMGNIGARTWRIVGVPASTAGQPGHCALVRMEHDPATGRYRCVGGQYATGGDEVTTVHAGWNLDDRGGRRGMVFQQTVAWGCNHGLASFVDALVLVRVWNALPEAERSAQAVAFVQAALRRNPFALAMVDTTIAAADAAGALALVDAFEAAVAGQLDAKEHALYRSTVHQLGHARLRALPPPADAAGHRELLAELERQRCSDDVLLARCWRGIDGEAGFTTRCRAAIESYLTAPARSKEPKVARAFAVRIEALGGTVKGKAAKAAWAEAMLGAFAGHEVLVRKGKQVVDPAVVHLCKLAGREPPSVGGSK